MINKYIGSGITFPFKVNSDGRLDIVNDESLINSSIKNIVYWPKMHRFFNMKFGCRLEELLEEPDDNVGSTLASQFIFEAIETWEKRIKLTSIRVLDSTEALVNIQLTYIIRSTRSEHTMVFPFYKTITF